MLTILLLGFLLLTPGMTQAAAMSCGSWSVVASPNAGTSSNFLQGVTATTTNDVWTVGFYFRKPGSSVLSRTLAEHWNGKQWSVIKSPNVAKKQNFLYGVSAASAKDVWAVGYNYASGVPTQTLIEHWNGNSWSIINSPNVGSSDQLNGVSALSANNAWAVGYANVGGKIQTLIEHWDGVYWTLATSPNTGVGSTLSSVTAISAKNAWAVGEYSSSGGFAQTLVEHWNGSTWSIVKSPNLGSSGNGLFGVTAVSAKNVWAVGYYSFSNSSPIQTLTEQWNGSTWQVVSSPNVAGNDNRLFSVSAQSAKNVWAVGYSALVGGGFEQTLTEQWNGTAWSIVNSPNVGPGNNPLNAVATATNNQVWAVGNYDSNSGVPQTLTEFYC